MARRNGEAQKKPNNGANLGFEQELRQARDKVRGHMDSAEYKHVVLGLIFYFPRVGSRFLRPLAGVLRGYEQLPL
ncbi:MAG TPA: hypothetical protein VOA64_19090 [Candidatus Dormibacteraeota bacterium]|nr:hypothetical protein [Candidatus Dormibacteraeota bacterium]